MNFTFTQDKLPRYQKQTLWSRFEGIHVAIEHSSRWSGGNVTKKVIVRTYKYPGFIRRFLRRIGIDKSDWSYVLISEKSYPL